MITTKLNIDFVPKQKFTPIRRRSLIRSLNVVFKIRFIALLVNTGLDSIAFASSCKLN